MGASNRFARLATLSKGIRFRTTAYASLTVAVALALGGVTLVVAVRAAQTRSVAATVAARVDDISALLAEDRLVRELPGRGEALVAQVVDAQGEVVAYSPDLAEEGPLIELSLAPGEETEQVLLEDAQDSQQTGHVDVDRFVLRARSVDSPDGALTIIVAGSLDPVRDSTAALVPWLLVVLPVVLVVVAGSVWILTGRALAPVESIRSQTEAVTATALDTRVPVPSSGDEIELLARTMNDMLDRLDVSAASQRRFVADASHELRSPVAAIRTMLEVAERHPDAVQLPTLLDDLIREEGRMEALTSDLLTLARFDERGLDVGHDSVDVCGVLAEEVASARARSQVTIHMSSTSSAQAHGDADRLSQVARNLVDNALRYASNAVWVGCHIEGDLVILTVSDDGPGIPSDKRDEVFERFVRLDDARARSGGGTGLGLAVCRAIVESHGGTIACVDPEHGGATFQVSLPVASRPATL